MNNPNHKKLCQMVRIFRKYLKIPVSEVAKTLSISEEELTALEKGENTDVKLCVNLIYYYYFQYTFPLLKNLSPQCRYKLRDIIK